MTPPHPATEAWAEWWRRLDTLKVSVSRIEGATVGSADVRAEAKEAVQHYFRQIRPQLIALRIDGASIDSLDQVSQHILELHGAP